MMIKHRVQHATTTAEAEIITRVYCDFSDALNALYYDKFDWLRVK